MVRQIRKFENQITFSQFSPQNLSLIIIGFGILVRVIQYLYNRSLWADEAVLALNIVKRSYWELLQPLDYEQGAPLGFLWVERLAVDLFGNNEYALRLFPLLSGIVSLFLFYEVAKRCIPPRVIPIALALFASLDYLVYYSTEVKQYASDVMFALLACLLVMQINSKPLNIINIVTFSLIGAIIIWFSHPVVFVLAGLGISYFLLSIRSQEKKQIFKTLIIYSSWLASFAVFYLTAIKSLNSDEDLMTSWKGAFPSSPFDIIWFLDAFGKFFYRPLGFAGVIDAFAILAFVLGCVSCFKRQQEKLLLLLSPFMVTVFAAYLHKYPFRSRLVIFLTPFFILLVAEGIGYLIRKNRRKITVLAGVALLLILLTPSVFKAGTLLFKPYLREEIKPVISYVKTRQQPQDVLYVFQRGKYQFKYYAERYGYREGDYILGVDDLDKIDGKSLSEAEKQRYQADLDKLRGNQRVWLLFSHATVRSENKFIKNYLDRIGKQIDFFESPGAFVYLYDLS